MDSGSAGAPRIGRRIMPEAAALACSRTGACESNLFINLFANRFDIFAETLDRVAGRSGESEDSCRKGGNNSAGHGSSPVPVCVFTQAVTQGGVPNAANWHDNPPLKRDDRRPGIA
jgi:hypothetical protein